MMRAEEVLHARAQDVEVGGKWRKLLRHRQDAIPRFRTSEQELRSGGLPVVTLHPKFNVNGGRISTVVDLHEVIHRVVLNRPAPSHDDLNMATSYSFTRILA